jgi:Tfp pilus assembly protein PilP
MKLTIGILAVGLMTGAVWAQNPQTINNGQNSANASTQSAKPVAGAPAKPTNTPTKPTVAPAKAPAPPAKAAVTPAKTTVAPAKTTVTPAKVVVVPVVVHSAPAPVAVAAKKPQPVPAPTKPVAHPTITAKEAAKPAVSAPTKIVAEPGVESVSKVPEAPKPPKPEDKKWAMTGKRDPFFSPVVQAPTGSGCATGKKCLEIGQINLRGVVKSDGGFIAVVTNSLNKAYFLRENDPVFNGYVVRITGDSVVFQETVQDKLGKPLIREVVKRIFTPAV